MTSHRPGRRRGAVGLGGLVLLVLLALLPTSLPTSGLGAGVAAAQTGGVRATIDDDELSWGDTATVTASGFAPGVTVRVILHAGGIELAKVAADGTGGVRTAVTIPDGLGSSNRYVLAVQGPAGDGTFGYTTIPLTVVGPPPEAGLATDRLSWRQVVTATGRRYNPGTKVSISLFPDNKVLGSATVGGDGSFAVPVEVPSGIRTSTEYQVAFSGQGIDKLFHFNTQQITIVGDRPVVEVAATEAQRGQSVGVTGRIFAPGGAVQITLLPGFERLLELRADDTGGFTARAPVPAGALGRDPHFLVVTGFGADGLFTFDVTPLTIGDGPEVDRDRDGSALATSTTIAAVRPPTDRTTTTTDPGDPRAPERGRGWQAWWLLLLLLLLLFVAIVGSSKRRRRR